MEAFVDDHCFRLVHPRSLKVIEIDAIRKLGCGFLFCRHSKIGYSRTLGGLYGPSETLGYGHVDVLSVESHELL